MRRMQGPKLSDGACINDDYYVVPSHTTVTMLDLTMVRLTQVFSQYGYMASSENRLNAGTYMACYSYKI